MKNTKYYVGFDIGTDSVGYAVTDENCDLCKFRGNPMWGVTLFDEAQTAAERRTFRTARRRLDRKQQRVRLTMDLFAEEIGKEDACFFKRIKESYHYPETENDKVRLFDSYDKQKEYVKKYPTIWICWQLTVHTSIFLSIRWWKENSVSTLLKMPF